MRGDGTTRTRKKSGIVTGGKALLKGSGCQEAAPSKLLVQKREPRYIETPIEKTALSSSQKVTPGARKKKPSRRGKKKVPFPGQWRRPSKGTSAHARSGRRAAKAIAYVWLQCKTRGVQQQVKNGAQSTGVGGKKKNPSNAPGRGGGGGTDQARQKKSRTPSEKDRRGPPQRRQKRQINEKKRRQAGKLETDL